ncbi:hypothetical protein CL616_04800 [archaeon]|nr:hypothetical protein [archaeon]
MEKLELTPKKIEDLMKQPVIEANMFKSMDGKWFIHKTTTTSIKPIEYINKVLGQVVEEV